MKMEEGLVKLLEIPQPIRAVVAELPKAGTPMSALRKRAFLRALSAVMDYYYPEPKK